MKIFPYELTYESILALNLDFVRLRFNPKKARISRRMEEQFSK